MSYTFYAEDGSWVQVGPIPAEGRTYSTSLFRPFPVSGTQHYDYIDMTFANLRDVPATGMKIFIKENSPFISHGAAVSANVTGNIKTGWVSAAVDIDGISGTETIKTKTVRFNLGTSAYQNNDLLVRSI
jgi:hypothetical protein